MVSSFAKWALAIVCPLLVTTAYLFLSREPSRFSATSDYIAFALAIAIGVIAIASLRSSLTSRVILIVIYVPVALFALISFSLVFVCAAFNSCL